MNTSTQQGAGVTIRREITWMDTDASTFWHNTTAMRLVEQAESLLHRGLVPEEPFGGPARVRVDVTFQSRLSIHEMATVVLRVARIGNTSIEYAFTIHNERSTLCASGLLIAVQVDHRTGRAIPWTPLRRARLQADIHLDELAPAIG